MNYKIISDLRMSTAFFWSLLFFGVASLLGLALRLAFSFDFPDWFSFTNVRHTHSHLALLGWLFAAFVLAIIRIWKLDWNKFRNLYIMMQVAVLGMAVTFPFMGYAPASILFTTMHLLLAYVLLIKIWRNAKRATGLSFLMLKTAIVFFFLSTLGVWSLGPLMMMAKGSAMYYASVQWYLHFMFNGWMVFSLLAILFKWLENHDCIYPRRRAKLFYFSLVISTILTFALAVTWSTPVDAIFYINSFAVLLQLIAFVTLAKVIGPFRQYFESQMDRFGRNLLYVSLMALVLKVCMQAAVVLPTIAKVSYTIKNFVVGFIHLLMLGCLTLFLLAFASQYFTRKISQTGTWVLIFGIVMTEFFLFYQGLMIWLGRGFLDHYYHLMSLGSVMLAVGVGWVAIYFYKQNRLFNE
ncbi:MAG: hypothetical protein KDC49_13700 [Saprospiraceae bacterium]|nr:hypothetical protein [Saprospiraceae bacterium]